MIIYPRSRIKMSHDVQLKVVLVEKADEVNIILGQSHFIKTVEDLHEAIVNSCPGRPGMCSTDLSRCSIWHRFLRGIRRKIGENVWNR